MALDSKKLDKPLLKLRKVVRKMSKVPTQDEVHDIRTNTLRVEATLTALQLDHKRKGRRLLGAVTPMRKKAGDVLSDCKDCKVLGQIKEIAKHKFVTALGNAQRLRGQYFNAGQGNQKTRKTVPKADVLKASAKLAA